MIVTHYFTLHEHSLLLIIEMCIQNSSKSYPQIYGVQNKTYPAVEVQIHGRLLTLTSKDFFELTQLIEIQSIDDIKNQGLQSLVMNQNNLAIAHILLYYCIKVNLRIQLQGLESFYLKQLGNLYVASRFHIQIGKYSKLCCLFTGIQIRKCAHIIYYLVYGRLATNSYIDTIIAQLAPQLDRKQKYKPIQSQNLIPRNVGKEKQAGSEDMEENIYDDLIEDLKNIFQKPPSSLKKQKASSYISKPPHPQQPNPTPKQHQSPAATPHPQQKYYTNFFPNRIFNSEKSAILQRMHPSNGPNYKLMRKKRFNDSKIQKLLYSTFTSTEEKDNNCQKIMGEIGQCFKEKNNRLFNYSSVKNNEKFRNVSVQLDKIRGVITKGSKRRYANHQFCGNGSQSISQKERQYLELKERVQKQQPQSTMTKSQLFKPDFDCKNQFISLIRKEKNGNRSKKGNDQNKRNSGDYEGVIFKNLGSGNSGSKMNKIFHSDCQNRLFQYKNEYRKFMKVHFFVIDDQ